MSEDFDAFWEAYPRRAGANPRFQARISWDKAISGNPKKKLPPACAEDIIAGAKAYASDPSTKTGTEFVAMATTWLNQRRWEDYQHRAATHLAPQPSKPTHGLPWGSGVWLMADTAEWVAWKITQGRRYPTDRFGGWTFPGRWPPEDSLSVNATERRPDYPPVLAVT